MAIKNGFYGNHYLHYSADNVDGLSNISTILQATKQTILDNAITQWSQKVKSKAQELSNTTNLSLNEAESFLSGNFFKSLNNVSTVNINGNDIDIQNSIDIANQIISTTPDKINKISDVLSLLEKYAREFFGTNLDTLKSEYAAVVIQDFASNKSRMKISGNVGSSLLNSVLGRYNTKFFKTHNPTESSKNLDMAMKQILLLLEGLPELGNEVDKRYNYGVLSEGQSVSNRRTVKGESKIAQALLGKVQGWVMFLQNTVLESAEAAAMINGTDEFKDAMEKMHAEIQRTGNWHKMKTGTGFATISTDVQIDPALEDFFQKVGFSKQVLDRMNSRPQAKSDVSFFINKNNVTGQIGITDKDYGITTTKASDGTFLVSGSTSIQNNTPLLTLLVRELGMKQDQLYDILQLAIAHDDTGGFDYNWQQLIQNIKYSAFLDALTGMISILDTSYFIALNGNIYTISNFLQSFRQQLDSGAKVNMVQSKGDEKGLLRSSYVSLNQWMSTRSANRNWFDASLRSKIVTQDATKLLYNTKVQILIDLNNLILQSKVSGLF